VAHQMRRRPLLLLEVLRREARGRGRSGKVRRKSKARRRRPRGQLLLGLLLLLLMLLHLWRRLLHHRRPAQARRGARRAVC
jgi:hypothetical protein